MLGEKNKCILSSFLDGYCSKLKALEQMRCTLTVSIRGLCYVTAMGQDKLLNDDEWIICLIIHRNSAPNNYFSVYPNPNHLDVVVMRVGPEIDANNSIIKTVRTHWIVVLHFIRQPDHFGVQIT